MLRTKLNIRKLGKGTLGKILAKRGERKFRG